jgi:hypothetical protein
MKLIQDREPQQQKLFFKIGDRVLPHPQSELKIFEYLFVVALNPTALIQNSIQRQRTRKWRRLNESAGTGKRIAVRSSDETD